MRFTVVRCEIFGSRVGLGLVDGGKALIEPKEIFGSHGISPEKGRNRGIRNSRDSVAVVCVWDLAPGHLARRDIIGAFRALEVSGIALASERDRAHLL